MQIKVIIYLRVSTIMQSIHGKSLATQKIKGEQLAKELGYSEEEILVISDEGVSSRKKKLHERSGMYELLKLIRTATVEALIVYDRDRLARKMIDHLKIIDELKKYNVGLYFSGEEVTAYTGDIALEASLALYAELEGDKINQRSNQARKFYPNMIPGYLTVGKGGEKRYEPKNDEEYENIKQLFKDFKEINTLEAFLLFNNKWRRVVKDPKKILANGFYAAVLIDGERLIPMSHIPPIVELETILDNRNKFKKWGLNKEKEIANTILDQMDIQVFCEKCERNVSQRLIRGEFKFYCNHGVAGNKERVSLLAKDVISIVLQSISDLCSIIDPKLIETIVLKDLKNRLQFYKKEIIKIDNQKNQLISKIRASLDDAKTLKSLLKEEEEDLSLQMKVKDEMALDLTVLIQDISSFLDGKFYEDINNYIWMNLIPAGQLLIHSVKIDNEQVQVLHYFEEAKVKEYDTVFKR
jgi:DNA invertase Pin-like site-specific DNA recombinase